MTMILRNIAVRHGRKALATPLRRSVLRTMSTEHQIEQASSIVSTLDHQYPTNDSSASSSSSSSPAPAFSTAATPTPIESVRQNFEDAKYVRKTTARLGSKMEPFYQPRKLVNIPNKPEDVTLELLMASQAHMGHSTSLWNPANGRYIYGIREGIHIISLEATAAHLRRAAKVVEGVAYHGGLILWVGTRSGQDRAVIKAAQLSKGCHLFQRWVPGAITNGDQILEGCKQVAIDEFDEPVNSSVINRKLEEHRSIKPDLVIVLNPLENYICLHECGLKNIPTIGIIDTDADPTWVTYPIPANDDSLRCVNIIAGILGRAGESGQAKRIEAARSGKVTWETRTELKKWALEDEALIESLYPPDHPFIDLYKDPEWRRTH